MIQIEPIILVEEARNELIREYSCSQNANKIVFSKFLNSCFS